MHHRHKKGNWNMNILLRLCLFCVFFLGSVVWGEEFDLDKAHTHVGFSVRHMVVSNTHGQFKEFSGTLVYDPNDLASSKFTAKIQTNTINTDNEKRDAHLKSPDFFDVAQFPEIIFESTKFEKSAEKIHVTGNLTMHGVTKEVILPFEITDLVKDPWGNTRLGMLSEFVVDRQDYGIGSNSLLDNGGLVIGNAVKVEVSTEWILKKS
jgi:polyisoprenoid-binding protein YceI